MNNNLVVSMIVVAFILGLGGGYVLTPEYANMSSERQSGMMEMELGKPDRFIDQRYLNGMIAHHQSAIFMLEQAQEKSTRPEIQNLADAIIEVDTKDIEKLYSYKQEWYGDSSKVTDFREVNLGDGDDKFDLRLLNALLIHHDEAIAQAMEIQSKSTRTETLNIASNVINTLSANADQLRAWRKEWYGI